MADNIDIFREFNDNIQKSDIKESEKKKNFDIMLKMRNQKINLMITGATGVEKVQRLMRYSGAKFQVLAFMQSRRQW